MKTKSAKPPLKPALRYTRAVFLVRALGTAASFARPRPPLPPLPERQLLFHAGFDAPNWWEFPDGRPLLLSGVETVESWSGYAVNLAGKGPAVLRFPLVDAKGNARLTADIGTLRFWFCPAWSSAPLGAGPGAYGRLIELGAWTADASVGWWALGVTPDGASLVFAAQARGQSVEYLKAPIQFQAGQWHQVALTYGANGSALYVDGQLAALGAGVTHWPEAAAVLAEGFALGSDGDGLNLAQGQFDELATFAQPLNADEVAWNYRIHAAHARLGPISPEEEAARLFLARTAAASRASLLDEGEGDVCAGCTNLKLVITLWTNEVLPRDVRLDFCCKSTAVRYDLVCATNLGVRDDCADVDWDWVEEIASTETQFFTNAWASNAFFRVVRVLDPDGFGQPSLYVSASAPPGGDGSKDLPFQDLQAALNAATNYSVIQVLPGVYSGVSNRNLSFDAKKLVLVSERGWEQTIIDCANASGSRGFVFTTTNDTSQDVVILGFTVSNAANSAVYCSGGSKPAFINCAFVQNQSPDGGGAVYCTNAGPVFVNCRFLTNSANGSGGAVCALGSNATPWLSHCTLSDNGRANGGGQIYAAGHAYVNLNNCIVWGPANLGPEIVRPEVVTTNYWGLLVTNYEAGLKAKYCDIRGWTEGGVGNLNVDPQLETNGSARLTVTSPCIDQGTTNTFPGFRLFARYDMDGEARLDHSQFTNATPSAADIGADEFVYRLQFPRVWTTNWVRGADGLYSPQPFYVSEVDEASGVAYLGTTSTGPILAVVDDESRTNFYIYRLNGDASAIQQSITQPIPEVADMEGLTFNSASNQLYLICSQTKRNRYRDVDSSPPIAESVVDPPASDYHRRRTALLSMQLSAGLTNVVSTNLYRADNVSDADAVGYDATNGLVAFMHQQLYNNSALREVSVGTKVLIATNSANKFGTPVNGTAYSVGAALPYANGGLATNAGAVLAVLDPGAPYGSFTNRNLISGSTNFYKIWAVDAQNNYYPGPVAGVTNDGLPRLFINEFYAGATASQTNWIELYNPAFVPVNLGGLQASPDGITFKSLPASNAPARGFIQLFARTNSGDLNLGFTLTNSGNLVLRQSSGQILARYPYTNETANITEGPAWDAGPRGFVSPSVPCSGAKFANGTSYPPTPRASNDTNAHKYLSVTPDITGTSNYLAWQNIGASPAVWRYSPKQHDFHALNVEDIAFRSSTEMIIGLRAPLTSRTNGDACYFRVTNLTAFLPAGSGQWTNVAPGVAGPYTLNLEGLGIRSIKWCPQGMTNAQGNTVSRYLILAGTANGGPLQREDYRQKFSLYSWTGNTNDAPSKLIADLWPYALRPEGVDLIQVAGLWRILFVEDRFLGTGYATRHAIHWPLSIVGPVP